MVQKNGQASFNAASNLRERGLFFDNDVLKIAKNRNG
jgi:hypothetical protein